MQSSRKEGSPGTLHPTSGTFESHVAGKERVPLLPIFQLRRRLRCQPVIKKRSSRTGLSPNISAPTTTEVSTSHQEKEAPPGDSGARFPLINPLLESKETTPQCDAPNLCRVRRAPVPNFCHTTLAGNRFPWLQSRPRKLSGRWWRLRKRKAPSASRPRKPPGRWWLRKRKPPSSGGSLWR